VKFPQHVDKGLRVQVLAFRAISYSLLVYLVCNCMALITVRSSSSRYTETQSIMYLPVLVHRDNPHVITNAMSNYRD
jgi:hypothetical protein